MALGIQASGERIDVVVFGSDGYFGPTTLTHEDLVVGGALNSMIQVPATIGAPNTSASHANGLDVEGRSDGIWMHILLIIYSNATHRVENFV